LLVKKKRFRIKKQTRAAEFDVVIGKAREPYSAQ